MALPNPLTVLAVQVIEGSSSATELLRQLEGIPLAGLTKLIVNIMGLGTSPDFGSFLFALHSVIHNLFNPVSVGDEPHNTAESKSLVAQGIRTSALIAMPKKVDQDQKFNVFAATGDTRGAGVWQKIDGLANDQVFVVQRFRITFEPRNGGWLFIFPGRPFGSYLGQDGDDIEEAVIVSPGVTFLIGNPLLTSQGVVEQMMQMKPVAIFRLQQVDAGGLGTVMELDLKPNYVSLRSYWQVYVSDAGAETSPEFIVQMFGQKMPYSLPGSWFNVLGH